MKNNSLFNGSNDTQEFPYWRPTPAITLFNEILVTCCVVCLYLFLLVVLLKIKKSHFQPLNIVHMSILISSILDDVIRTILIAVYTPSVYRNCTCSQELSTIFATVIMFSLVFRPLPLASLGVLQLLTIVGIKKFANVKTASGMIALYVGISSIFVASTIHLVHNSGELLVCFESYCPNSGRDSGIGTLITLLIVIIFSLFIPSLAVTILTSTWSCARFKKNYTGGDDQLNRRMLSLPVIMPLTIMATSMTEAIMIALVTIFFIYTPFR